VFVALGVAACSGNRAEDREVSAAPAATPTAVPPLPDLSKLVPTVQTQIQAQHTLLAHTLENASSTLIERANAHGELAKLFMAAQLPEAAEAGFDAAQSLNPSDYRWPYYLAQLARSQGDLAKASTRFERVLQLNPDDMDTLVWYGDVSLAAGKPDVAGPAFARALQIDPNSVSARYGAGRTALAQGDHRSAVAYLEDVLRINPKATAAHYPLSMAYSALGDAEKAAEHLRLRRDGRIAPRDTLMVELDALLESPQTFESLGIRRLDAGDWAGAAEQFRKGLALAPDSAALHHRLGTALSLMNDQKGARTEFETAIQKSPEHFPAQYSLGVMLQAEGRHAAAVERFAAALKARPTYTEARLRMASSLRRTGRTREALDEYAQALGGAQENTEARVGYAMTLAKLRRDREARQVLEEIATRPGADPAIAHAFARLLAASPDRQVRDGTRAKAVVEQLLARGRTIELGETYAMALAELGLFREAQSLQRDLTAAAERAGMTTGARARLAARQKLYDWAEPCRTPWTDDEMP
jgi:tetratricopeptide (TPR) repeat protein